VRWMGVKCWQSVHRAGLYFLWVSFLITFGKRIPMSGGYVLPVAVLLAALAFRLWRKPRGIRPAVAHPART
jgi:sulfoxide reductase heme-binding subunit YedZ